jgi:hypothetical protein
LTENALLYTHWPANGVNPRQHLAESTDVKPRPAGGARFFFAVLISSEGFHRGFIPSLYTAEFVFSI